jgi:hypothetical protein
MGAGDDGGSTLFVLAGSSLGATLIEGEGAPQWFDLRRVVALDALGDPEGPKIRVEVVFDDGERFEALWPEPFCDKVVARLEELLSAGTMTRAGESPSAATAEVERPAGSAPALAPAQPFAQTGAGASPFGSAGAPGPGVGDGSPTADVSLPAAGAGAPAPPPSAPERPIEVDLTSAPGPAPAANGNALPTVTPNGESLPLPGDGPPLSATPNEAGERELVLRDVIYHGGYPGESKRRKKCTLVVGRAGIQVSGPAGPQVQLAWEQVRSIEAQNADEAKFRLNLRAKRGSTTLVIECGDDTTVLVEARDVPTLPLRAAVAEIVAGRGVVVA